VKRVHIIGRKNHGKTTLVVELVQALSARGLRVGTIKHTHHHHELDTPGKDSHRHRESGAAAVGICSPSMNAVFWSGNRDTSQSGSNQEDKYAVFAAMFERCDLVLVEGDTQTDAVKVEVWRSAVGSAPIALDNNSVAAVITDDVLTVATDVPVWPRSDVNAVVDGLLSLLNEYYP
jgi:molybdopterin-guanine dinucleotide biosynthesis protein MobB